MSDASIPLGRHVDYPSTYDASLLFPIPRAQGREAIGVAAPLPFIGHDRWHAYELSWLDGRGKPIQCNRPINRNMGFNLNTTAKSPS